MNPNYSTAIKCAIDDAIKDTVIDAVNGPVFTPQLYRQRYQKLIEILSTRKIESIADLGCSRGHLIPYLKTLPSLKRIVCVDSDLEALYFTIKSAEPTDWDRINRRRHPLSIEIYHGNAAEWDPRIADVDAVVAVELIEHMSPVDFERFPENIFSNVKPRIAIFTTPNADFNPLFPWFGSRPFRHDDHTFEFGRKEFKEWCDSIVNKFPNYSVVISGVGQPPLNAENFGCCTQVAVFSRTNDVERPIKTTDTSESSVFLYNYRFREKIDYEAVKPTPSNCAKDDWQEILD